MCNINLDRNAVQFLSVRPGMVVRAAHEAGLRIVDSVDVGSVTFADGSRVAPRHPNAGTLIWVDAPASYNYHAGHGCVRDN